MTVSPSVLTDIIWRIYPCIMLAYLSNNSENHEWISGKLRTPTPCVIPFRQWHWCV